MHFDFSPRGREWLTRVETFMAERVVPNVPTWEHQAQGRPSLPLPIVQQLKAEARAAGLWNLFMPPAHAGENLEESFRFDAPKLGNLEYAPLAEAMGRVRWAPEIFNCSAPDTGNMEVFERFGTREQKDRWLRPLMDGEIRSAFLMTEPAVASSDATNIETSIVRDGNEYVINGRKWWTSGANDPRCRVLIFMGQSSPDHADPHKRQSMILVSMDTPGVKVLRHLPVFGYDDAPHGHAEMLFENVRVPASNMLLGEGRGFEIAQGRLGPGRIHHCMRVIGRAERALEMMCRRSLKRVAFGRKLSDQGVTRERIAQSRILIDQARWLVLHAAWKMDKVGNKAARQEIAMIKVAAPSMAGQVIDWAMQLHGGGSVSDDFGLARAYASTRTLRFADGPDEVHRNAIAKLELARYADAA